MSNDKIFKQNLVKVAKKCIMHDLKEHYGTDYKNIKLSYKIDKDNKVLWNIKFFNNLYMDKDLIQNAINKYAGGDLKSNIDNICKINPLFINYVVDYYRTFNKGA